MKAFADKPKIKYIDEILIQIRDNIQEYPEFIHAFGTVDTFLKYGVYEPVDPAYTIQRLEETVKGTPEWEEAYKNFNDFDKDEFVKYFQASLEDSIAMEYESDNMFYTVESFMDRML